MQRVLDAAAVGLSALCMIHCLALPLVAAFLPLAGQLAKAEWVHWAVLAAAAPVALIALAPAWAKSPVIPTIGAGGIGFLALGALHLPGLPPEIILSTVGGVLLASAHILNWRRAHRRDAPSCPASGAISE